ncbi:hypothetical protein WJX72_009937 [[Myrmecia] bisecta]|uniref:Protein kinase domain-containing protein n=1 Tax=[Myrmecia] bisecta TaxID=41462 RepID=A0AAW1PSK0_9CHLO
MVKQKHIELYREGLEAKLGLQKSFYEKVEDFSNVVLVHESWFKLYRARCRVSKGLVILKVYGREILDNATKARIVHEYNLCKNLGNGCPHVLRVFDAFDDKGSWVLVCEHSAAGNLYTISCRSAALLQMQEGWLASMVIAPVLATLAYLHSLGITHRDVKPEHISFTSAGICKLNGFFLAVNEAENSRSETICGTLDYIAPETLLDLNAPGRKRVKPAVDIWAVGILVFDMLTGSPPFSEDDADSLVRMITLHTSIDFPDFMSAKAIDFTRQALIKSPKQRPSATALLQHDWITMHRAWVPPDDWVSPLHMDIPRDEGEPPKAKGGVRMILESIRSAMPLPSKGMRKMASVSLPSINISNLRPAPQTPASSEPDATVSGQPTDQQPWSVKAADAGHETRITVHAEAERPPVVVASPKSALNSNPASPKSRAAGPARQALMTGLSSDAQAVERALLSSLL